MSNVPVTRTPDAHWMAEVRYRGTKIVTVSPDYADNTKFADEWLAAQAGTDAALAMAMGHVILKEFFVDRQAVLHRVCEDLHRPSVLDHAYGKRRAWRPGTGKVLDGDGPGTDC
jgi:nitrate reductase alpha subunit